jgi:hypothetical protein
VSPIVNFRLAPQLVAMMDELAQLAGVNRTDLLRLWIVEERNRKGLSRDLTMRFVDLLNIEYGEDATLIATLTPPRTVMLAIERDGDDEPQGIILETIAWADPASPGFVRFAIGDKSTRVMLPIGSVPEAPGATLRVRLGDLPRLAQAQLGRSSTPGEPIADEELPEDPDWSDVPEELRDLEGKSVTVFDPDSGERLTGVLVNVPQVWADARRRDEADDDRDQE